MSDFKNHGDKPIEFCGDQEGWIAVGSLTDDSPLSPCYPRVVLLGVGLGPSGKEHPSNIAAMLTIAQATDLRARLTEAMAVDRPVTAPTPAPGLDLDAVERTIDASERAQPGYGVPAVVMPAPTVRALIDEVRALRAQVCRLVSGQAIESDALCQHHDADLAALAEVAILREKLTEAKRLGMEACEAARLADSDLMRATARIGAGGHGMATRHTNNIAATAAALEAL